MTCNQIFSFLVIPEFFATFESKCVLNIITENNTIDGNIPTFYTFNNFQDYTWTFYEVDKLDAAPTFDEYYEEQEFKPTHDVISRYRKNSCLQFILQTEYAHRTM